MPFHMSFFRTGTTTERRKVSVSFLGLVHIDPIHPSEFLPRTRQIHPVIPVICGPPVNLSSDRYPPIRSDGTRTYHSALGSNRINEILSNHRIADPRDSP